MYDTVTYIFVVVVFVRFHQTHLRQRRLVANLLLLSQLTRTSNMTKSTGKVREKRKRMPLSELTAVTHKHEVGVSRTGMVDLAPKWVRLAPNGTNPGLFQIRFQSIWRPRAKCTEI